MKKMLIIVLALLMLSAVFAGCAPRNDNQPVVTPLPAFGTPDTDIGDPGEGGAGQDVQGGAGSGGGGGLGGQGGGLMAPGY